jgi:hypothetical protein
MPPDALHKKKLKKNLTVAGLIIFWVILIWAVTVVRLSAHAAEENDQSKAFAEQRAKHQANAEIMERDWGLAYNHHEAARERNEGVRNNNRILHAQYTNRAEEVWFKKWQVKEPLRRLFEMVDDRGRSSYLATTTGNPEKWWHQKPHPVEGPGKTAWPGGSHPQPPQQGPGGQITMQPSLPGNGGIGIQTSVTFTPIENAGEGPGLMIVRSNGNSTGVGGRTLRMNSAPQVIDTGDDGIYHENPDSGY